MSERDEGFTITDLEVQKLGLEGRIKQIETDLKMPYSPNPEEQALQTTNLIFLKRLLEVERSNLRKVNFELSKRLQMLEISKAE